MAVTARDALLDRLGRRGVLTITVEDGVFDVRLAVRRPSRTIDAADLDHHCRFGPSDWHGEGADVEALLAACDEASRPARMSVDDIVWNVELRRSSRTHGPPLPSYRRWHGWRPGHDRWLRTSSHAWEYLAGYERDLRVERQFDEEQRQAAIRRTLRERRRVRDVLNP